MFTDRCTYTYTQTGKWRHEQILTEDMPESGKVPRQQCVQGQITLTAGAWAMQKIYPQEARWYQVDQVPSFISMCQTPRSRSLHKPLDTDQPTYQPYDDFWVGEVKGHSSPMCLRKSRNSFSGKPKAYCGCSNTEYKDPPEQYSITRTSLLVSSWQKQIKNVLKNDLSKIIQIL